MSCGVTLLREDVRWQQHFSHGACEQPARAALPMPPGASAGSPARIRSPGPACGTSLASPQPVPCLPQGLAAPLSFLFLGHQVCWCTHSLPCHPTASCPSTCLSVRTEVNRSVFRSRQPSSHPSATHSSRLQQPLAPLLPVCLA